MFGGFPLNAPLKEILVKAESALNNFGLFHRVFGRVKSEMSLTKKLAEKETFYRHNNCGLQDLFGIRVTAYFQEDIIIVNEILNKEFNIIPSSTAIDLTESTKFGPTRYNLVFEIPSEIRLPEVWPNLIEKTFEVQIRTVFSEGWHEIEHDMRYKCKNDWDSHNDLARALNGVVATLESCDWTIEKIFDELSVRNYKENNLPALIRNKLKIRFKNPNIISSELFKDKGLEKAVFSLKRNEYILRKLKKGIRLPLTMDNAIFLINRITLKNNDIINNEPTILKNIIEHTNWSNDE